MKTIRNVFWVIALALLGWGSGSAQNWQPLPIHFDYTPYALQTDTSTDVLYILGQFQFIDGIPTNGIVKFDGNTWDSVGTRFQLYPISTMLENENKLYVGGGGLAIWNGLEWSIVPSNGLIRSLYPYQGHLLVGGLYSTIGVDSLSSLAAFDGQGWHDAFGTQDFFRGKQNAVSSFQEYNNELYIAGNIDNLGTMKEIMKWDGNSWTDVGGGIGGGGMCHINDLEVYQGELFVGGYFNEADGSPGNNIARWNGVRWSNVGEGLGQGQVFKLYTFEGRLYASGQFQTAGGVPATFIAFWDGTGWCSFGGSIDNVITGMAAYQGDLYVAGGFWTMNADSIRGIAKWIGGNYVDTCVYTPMGLQASQLNSLYMIAPNPTNSSFTMTLPANISTCTLKIDDITGREVAASRTYRAGDPPVDVTHVSDGLYFVEVRVKDRVEVIKLVKE